MPSKRKVGVHVNTFARVQQAPESKSPNRLRLERIRQESTSGKDYNIITGAELPYLKPSGSEKVAKNLAHPSMLITAKVLDR